ANRAAEAERAARRDAQAEAEAAQQARAEAVAAAAREAAERRKAEAAKADAQAKEAEANAVARVFADPVFAARRPRGVDGGLGHEVSLLEAVDASLPALGTSFKDRPLAEARLRMTLGTTLAILGQAARSADQLEKARDLLVRHLGPDNRNTLACMHNLAASYA